MHLKINISFFRLMLLLVLILVLVQSALAFNLTLAWIGDSNVGSSFFGISVSSGDFNGDGYADVLVGAYEYAYSGRAFVYYGGPSGVSLESNWSVGPDHYIAYFGGSVSSGDFNGDGYDDVLVGAPIYDNGENSEGRVNVYYGSPSGISLEPNWTAESNQESAELGWFLSSGDFNGDDYDDVVVSAYKYDNGETDEGRVYVYYGSPSGISSEPDWTAESNQAYAYFGYSVSSGDFNGDGYDDVLVGAYGYDNDETDEGRAYVYLGGPSGISSDPAWTSESNQDNGKFGWSVSSGDFNGDSYADVLVSAPYYDNGETDEGRAYVYLGGPSGISSDPAWTSESNQDSARFGQSVSSGDINGDGYDDVLVCADLFDDGETNEGRAYVYLGGPSGISSDPAWTASDSNQDSAAFGHSVSSGDFNGDGYDDVLIGAHGYDKECCGNEGRAYVYFYTLPLPVYSNFMSSPHTTDLSAVPDLTNVTNLTLENLFGMLQFPHNHSVNVAGKNLDAHIKLGDCYVSVNLSGLDSTFNASAYLTLNNSDGHCGNDKIYYAPGVYNSANEVRSSGFVCRDCEKLIADNHKVKFKVFHFSSYAIGSNANLTIYDSYENSAAQPNTDIIFYANYTNKSGSHISGATCTIYFDGNTNDKHNMTDNGNNYNYTFSFGSTGTHNYNITCSATNYNTLSAVDDVNVESGVVPEFTNPLILLVMLIMFSIFCFKKKPYNSKKV